MLANDRLLMSHFSKIIQFVLSTYMRKSFQVLIELEYTLLAKLGLSDMYNLEGHRVVLLMS